LGKNKPSGSDGNISCSNLIIKTLQRAFLQRFGDGINDCSRAEVLFYRINFCLIFERMENSQSNASFPMSCCSPMPRRSLLRSSLPEKRFPLSISFIQQSIQDQILAQSQTYHQIQVFQCCVARQ